MKGSPADPQCGFSRKMIALLQEACELHFKIILKNSHQICLGLDFSHFDILSDEKVRQALKEYSNWPTYPQLYAKGELIGGLGNFEARVKCELRNNVNFRRL